MDLAAVRLRDTDEPVESLSGAVGYASPHAFSRAFRRARGCRRGVPGTGPGGGGRLAQAAPMTTGTASRPGRNGHPGLS